MYRVVLCPRLPRGHLFSVGWRSFLLRGNVVHLHVYWPGRSYVPKCTWAVEVYSPLHLQNRIEKFLWSIWDRTQVRLRLTECLFPLLIYGVKMGMKFPRSWTRLRSKRWQYRGIRQPFPFVFQLLARLLFDVKIRDWVHYLKYIYSWGYSLPILSLQILPYLNFLDNWGDRLIFYVLLWSTYWVKQ